MTRRTLFPLSLMGLVVLVLALAACSADRPTVPVALAAPNVFSGPVNGGCYLDTITTCRLHIDRWQPIGIAANQKLEGFRLVALPGEAATGMILYDFRTDVSNPPSGTYLPSLVKQDFAAQCSTTYRLVLLAKDSGDASYKEVGRTDDFQCPAAATPTPTATPTATATAGPSPTPTVTGTPAPGWNLRLPVIVDG